MLDDDGAYQQHCRQKNQRQLLAQRVLLVVMLMAVPMTVFVMMLMVVLVRAALMFMFVVVMMFVCHIFTFLFLPFSVFRCKGTPTFSQLSCK